MKASLWGWATEAPEDMTNRPGDVRFKKHTIKMLKFQIIAIRRSMKEPDINGKLPGEYN